ncbi:MAG: minor capsid protein [Lachnospiraceae bacterium]|nr:minor capsid protein [Lachnospiraceae bacterium]
MASYEEYWIKRADERMVDIQVASNATVKNIRGAYDDAVKKLNKDIEKLFFNFSSSDGMTKEEAERLLKEKLSASEIESIRKQIDLIQDETIKKELLKKIDASYYKKRISRIEALKENIYIQTSSIADIELQKTTARYTQTIRDEYYKNIFDSQQLLGVAFSFSKIPEKVIAEVIRNNWSGKHYSKRIWENSKVLAEGMNDVVEKLLLKGLMTGENSKKLASELSRKTGVAKYACERLIRTENTYFSTMADIQAARQRGTTELKFVATLDKRTSTQCRGADGTIIKIDEVMIGKNAPPLHPFCRSILIDIIPGLIHKVRIARDPVTGENYKIPADMTYGKWEEKYVKTGILIAPSINNQIMKHSFESFETALNKNDDGSNLFQMVRMSKNNATYIEDKKMKGAYAYNIKTDEFRYNPDDKNFAKYDMNFVFSHELGHRLDATWCRSWENKKFVDAIDITKKKLFENENQIVEWMKGIPGEDPGFSDIISALSENKYHGIAEHNKAYWLEDKINTPMEIFANMVYIKTMKTETSAEVNSFLKELFEAMEDAV